MPSLLIQNGTLVTMDTGRSVLQADILIEKDTIQKIAPRLKAPPHSKVIDAKDAWVLPGFIQTHVHVCQTLFRNQAEDLELLDWLKEKIWPYEGRLSAKTLFLSAQLGICELLKGGTTTILDMGTVHHTDQIFKACEELGIRAFSGKAMMDEGEDIPSSLKESTEASLDERQSLIETWHGKANGRLHYALAPRFVLSCSKKLLKKCVEISQKKNLLIHTHTCENKTECSEVQRHKGKSTIHYLHDLGLCSSKSSFAHGVWLDEEEVEILAQTHTSISHCPSSNLKLASGIANVPHLIEKNITVSLGADGAPCNNTLDMFQEMKLAGLIQKPIRGVKALSAQKILEMATIDGAKALGIKKETGSLEMGKKADVILISKNTAHSLPNSDPYTTLVYSTTASDVQTVIVDGKVIVKNRKLLTASEEKILSCAC